MNDKLNLHKFDVYSETQSSPTKDNIFNRIDQINILRPFEPEYPHYFLQIVVKKIVETDIYNFLNRQLEQCSDLGKLKYRSYCKSFIEEKFNKKFLLTKPLKYELILEWIKNERLTIENQDLDDRIKGKLKNEEIEAYFMQLVMKSVLSKEEVIHILRANFAGFSSRVTPKKFDTPNFNQTQLRQFVYKFYNIHHLKKRTDDYIILLLNNFSAFDNTSFKSEKANFSK